MRTSWRHNEPPRGREPELASGSSIIQIQSGSKDHRIPSLVPQLVLMERPAQLILGALGQAILKVKDALFMVFQAYKTAAVHA